MTSIRAFTMPKWGIEMTEGTLAEWSLAEGETFSRGRTLCLIETDKITNEVDAEFDGTLRRTIAAAGDTLPVGALIGVFAPADVPDTEIDDFVSSFKAADTAVAAQSDDAETQSAKPQAPAVNPVETDRPISPEALKYAQENNVDLSAIAGSGRNGRISYQDVHQASRPDVAPNLNGPADLPPDDDNYFASPLARRLAALYKINLGTVKGTGPKGRISKADVLALVPDETQPAAIGQPFTPAENRPAIQPMDKIRKVVARRLTVAKTTIPHFYLRSSVCVDRLLEVRKAANLVLPARASINDYLVKAVARALVDHPDVNIQVHGEEIHRFPHADISVAVATASGLVTPILRSADLMRIDEIALATNALVEKAQAGRLGYDDLEGGTFTVSNLGMFGIDQFDAIINPPQGAILAVGGIRRVIAEQGDSDAAFVSEIALSLSCDHRAIDGAVGAAFMTSLKAYLEDPEKLFAS